MVGQVKLGGDRGVSRHVAVLASVCVTMAVATVTNAQPDAAPPRHSPPVPAIPFGDPVPLERLVAFALAQNPEIQATRYRASALAARVPQATSLGDPQLITTTFLDQIETAAGVQDLIVNVSQKFPWFGKLDLRGQVAQQAALAAHAEVAATELAVVQRVKHAYFELYASQASTNEVKQLQEAINDVVAVVRSQYEAAAAEVGLESVLQAQIELSKLRIRLAEFESNRRQSQARLAQLLHLPPATPLEATHRIDSVDVARTPDLLMRLAETCQPTLNARRREVARDRSAAALASLNDCPDVTVGFSWYAIGSNGISPVRTGDDAYSVGVGINVPIWRKRLDAQQREAECRAAASARRYMAAQDEVFADIHAIWAEFQQQHEVLETLESEILPRAQESLQLSMQAYRVGRIGFAELIDAYRILLEYRVDLHQRQAAREKAIASLERAVGCALSDGRLTLPREKIPAPVPPPRPPRPTP